MSRITGILIATALVLAPTVPATAAHSKSPTFNKAEKAGPDFLVQG